MSSASGPASPELPQLSGLVEQAPCGLLLTSSDGTIRRVNETFCRWVGWRADELVDRRSFQSLLTMGGRIFHQTHWAPLLQIQGSVAEVKLDMVAADGRRMPMVVNALRFEHAGTALHQLAVFVAQDRHQYERELLLARRRAEELLAAEQRTQAALALAQQRLKLSLELARLYLWEIDPLTRQARLEDRIALLLGEAAPRAVTAAEFEAAIHPDDRAAERAVRKRALNPQAPAAEGVYDARFRLLAADGSHRHVRATGGAFFDAQGVLGGFTGVLLDETELVRQRAQAEDRALFAEQMMGIVSHDLRNPLSVIQMSTLLLERSTPTERQQPPIARMRMATARMRRLISDLLDFTRARLGQGLKVASRPIALHAVVAEAVDELAVAFPEHPIRHEKQGDDTLACCADADRLTQAFGNLVANAAAYGDPARAITVRSIVERDGLRIEVHNHNLERPIDPALLPVLFEPMTRGDSELGEVRSVGLGLYIVREIVRAHGGEVGVVSDDQGTTFSLCFPRAQVPAGEQPPRGAA